MSEATDVPGVRSTGACEERVLEAGRGMALRVRRGQRLVLQQIQGGQVIDLVSLVEGARREHLSMVYSRLANRSWRLEVGHVLCSERARDLFRVADCGEGAEHYTGGGFCGPELNERRFGEAGTASCRANFIEALGPFGLDADMLQADSCLNAFMHVHYAPDGEFRFEAPRSRAGEVFALDVLLDQVVVLSSCPQERGPTNGGAIKPVLVRVES